MSYPLIRAKYYTSANRTHVDSVIIHDMEAPEKGDTAESVANFFARGATKASAHYCIDNDSIVQCVLEKDIAWHAPGANSTGIGVEHAGYASQSRGDWLDDYGVQMLTRSAALVADICNRYGIPKIKLSAADLLAGKRGIAGHADVTAAFHQSTHTDPGPNFPWDWYIGQVNAVGQPAPGPAPVSTPGTIEGKNVQIQTVHMTTDGGGNGWSGTGIPFNKVISVAFNPALDHYDHAPVLTWGNDGGNARIIATSGPQNAGFDVRVYVMD